MREAVLWGHHIDEYQAMFGLSDSDFNAPLLEFHSGANAVNTELQKRHQSMMSCDPWFALEKDVFVQKAEHLFHQAIDEIKKTEKQYDFSYYGGIDALIKRRREGILQCFETYDSNRSEGRYFAKSDVLPFKDFTFDYALSAYCLLSNTHQNAEFHLNTIQELARVAKEVRIFPLVDQHGQPSALLGPVLLGLQHKHYGVEIRDVDYQLQIGGHAMLRVWARECVV